MTLWEKVNRIFDATVDDFDLLAIHQAQLRHVCIEIENLGKRVNAIREAIEKIPGVEIVEEELEDPKNVIRIFECVEQ